MAIDTTSGSPTRFLSALTSTGNFTVGAGLTQVFVSIHGASGGGAGGSVGNRYSGSGGQQSPGGVGRIAGAWIQVLPGSTYAVAIGAGGAGGTRAHGQSPTSGNTGATGGTTTFDVNALVVTGGGGGASNATGAFPAPNTGNATGTTTLSTLPPSNTALARTGTITTQLTGGSAGGNAGGHSTWVSNPGDGGTGAAGQVYIYG
jgi:hypothetical protein